MGTDEGSSSGRGFSALPRRMTNEQLAHEVLIDPTFQLDTYGSAPGENYVKIRASFEEAYWKSLADDLRLPTPCYARISRTLVELRDGIHDMGPKPGDGSSPGVQGCGYAAAALAPIHPHYTHHTHYTLHTHNYTHHPLHLHAHTAVSNTQQTATHMDSVETNNMCSTVWN